VVRNGIDVDRLSISPEDGVRARRELGIPLMSPVVGTVAVFRAQKRLDLWLEAASRLARTTEAHFLLVGDGPMLARIQAQAQALDLGSRIHLPGLQEDVRPYLAAMDVYLMSSEFEGLPLALLEALAVGLPVVATAVGGIPEVLPDQESGILVPFGNPEALARAVSRLLEEPELRSKMGQRARQRVAEEFGIERMARELEEVYDRVLL
jgi:glycosyltransferase involved in cell wall biosynthesis